MSKNERLILIIVLGSIAAIGPFSIDMYLPSFPKIAEFFGETKKHVSYTLTSYFIGISIGQLMYGPLLEKFGRKKPLIAGLLIYVIASISIVLSANLTMMIVFRFLQALGASVGMVAGKSMIRDLFSTKEVARILSSILLVMGIAPIIAPTLGGIFVQYYNWQVIFVFLFAVGLLVLLSVIFLLKETRGYDETVTLRIKPIVRNYWNTLKDINFFRYTLASSIAIGVLFTYVSSIPFVLMDIYKVSETTFGWLFAINAIGFILGSQINRELLKKFDLKKLTNTIALMMAMITVLFLGMSYVISIPLFLFCVMTFGTMFMLGFVNPNATALSLDKFKSNIGIANALNGSVRMAMGAITSALIGYFYDGTMMPMLWFMAVLSVINLLMFIWAKKG